MRISMAEAETIVLSTIPDSRIVGKADYQGMYLFLAPFGDPDEGNFLPFFSVDPNTGVLSDFDVQAYDNPGEVLSLLNPPRTDTEGGD